MNSTWLVHHILAEGGVSHNLPDAFNRIPHPEVCGFDDRLSILVRQVTSDVYSLVKECWSRRETVDGAKEFALAAVCWRYPLLSLGGAISQVVFQAKSSATTYHAELEPVINLLQRRHHTEKPLIPGAQPRRYVHIRVSTSCLISAVLIDVFEEALTTRALKVCP